MRSLFLFCLLAFSVQSYSQIANDVKEIKVNSKDTDTWSAEEYSGLRGDKEVTTALLSKGFTWITGSPADNEKIAIGKNAQFFGFVALRYQSGRAANRGVLGRAMFSIASERQRDLMAKAVRDELESLKQWWAVREEILTQLEDHLYTGLPMDQTIITELGEEFGYLNSEVAIHEARAYAAFEDLMTVEQQELIAKWRLDPESARDKTRRMRVDDERVEAGNLKLLEDLYAKCFSWISGQREDNEIIPIGQPAQFFGFVALRHNSGHGANRGDIARRFSEILNGEQRSYIEKAVEQQKDMVRNFLEVRHNYLNQLSSLRESLTEGEFDQRAADEMAREMGRLEIQIAILEAQTYRKIRVSLSDKQIRSALDLRGNYVVDEAHIQTMSIEQRGETLAILCAGCHGSPNQWRAGMIGPNLDGFWDRPIASLENFEFSQALTSVAKTQEQGWTATLLDQYLASPKSFAPGTKMDFQGLINQDDRQAIIEYLRVSR